MSDSDQDLPATPPPFKARDYTEYWLGQNPTPVERADVIVKRLEQFIREGRSQRGGISFKRWQELAVHEVDNAIRDAERHWRNDQRFITRGLAVGAACLITIGFWGTVLAAEAAPDRQTAAVILIVAGGIMFAVLGAWGVRRLDRYYQLGRRKDHFARVYLFDRQLAQLDVDLEKRLKEIEETLDEMAKGPLDRL
ncbi:MAG: hypothetical protein QGH73_03370 [Rhodospirillales bacterium]|jgi:hypothetical protein|nr:hypothetical protein [Rhodospirillales bacterium]MDP6646150.1 hypothetical protein [Rhodospirillales bacterium]MDP6840699.1 hypothetical protein [Rhodospirillales bacterium]